MNKGSSFLTNMCGTDSRLGGMLECAPVYLRVRLTSVCIRALGHGQHSLPWSNSQRQMSECFSICGWQNDRVLTCVTYTTIPHKKVEVQEKSTSPSSPPRIPLHMDRVTLNKIQICIVQDRKSPATQFDINHLRQTAMNLNFPQWPY